ncbi:MAG: ABC transporter permease [Anaerolineae bacterium]|nr:ABC transporter permease [Candidatus Roseilinea sp.]MDW8449202.1 ABC transporter permease [Anaerolineae bacterium]
MAVQTAPIPVSLSEEQTRPGLLQRVFRSYVFRRLLKAFATIFAVVTATFFLIRLMPSNPVEIFIQEQIMMYGMSYQEARDQASALFAIDLDAPLSRQYLEYLGNLLRGDLGQSYRSKGTYVADIIRQFLPWTLFSVGTSLLISFILGVVLGMLMAYRRETPIDYALSTFASLVSSVPNYLIAIILLVVLGPQLKLINIASMRGSLSPGVQPGFTLHFFLDVLYHAALPIFVYVLTTIGGWMLAMKSSTIATLEEDYVTVARARGLKDGRIMTSYVGRNASLPLFTQLAISIGFVFGGSVLIEAIFVYQGIGQQLIKAINQRDYPVMQGIFLIITISVIMANLIADLLYSRLDPRIRLGQGETK